MSERRAEYAGDAEVVVVSELLRLFSAAQLAAICAQVRAIRESGYGEIAIRIEGDRMYLRPTQSISLGRVQVEEK